MGNSALKHHYETAAKTGVLNLSKSKINEFPAGLKQLHSVLRTLDLSENKFVELPSDIGLFLHLKSLTVNKNRLISLPDELGDLIKLETLSAVGNRLTIIPSSVSQLSKLKQVYLSDNLIKEFPLMLCGLKHLDVVDLSKNKITEVPKGVGTLNVTELNLNQNQISVLAEDIADCPRLKTLRMEENCLQLTAVPIRLLKESHISSLTVDGNLFEMKSFMDLEGYDKYMERYTAMKNKLL
ncbi:leucine-rich repeat-containing protein 57 [Lycorma delicatula]|uniref:leucine-rich repeat-containing protein 57 n=1 Tax=Lycorma delicatula TaxID=130591 RepID=UPI003F519BA1